MTHSASLRATGSVIPARDACRSSGLPPRIRSMALRTAATVAVRCGCTRLRRRAAPSARAVAGASAACTGEAGWRVADGASARAQRRLAVRRPRAGQGRTSVPPSSCRATLPLLGLVANCALLGRRPCVDWLWPWCLRRARLRRRWQRRRVCLRRAAGLGEQGHAARGRALRSPAAGNAAIKWQPSSARRIRLCQPIGILLIELTKP